MHCSYRVGLSLTHYQANTVRTLFELNQAAVIITSIVDSGPKITTVIWMITDLT